MEQLEQLRGLILYVVWLNLGVLSLFGFLVFCWFCETVNKWMKTGDEGERRRSQRRAQRPITLRKEEMKAEQQVTEVSAQIQAAIAEEVAKYANGTSP